MSNNITIKDSALVDRIVKTIERATVHTQVTELDSVSSYLNLDLDENGVSVLGSAAQLHNGEFHNDHSEIVYVKAYNKASAPASTDTPLRVWRVMPGGEFTLDVGNGIAFPLGLGLRCTTGRANNDTGGPPANTVLVNIGYRAG